MRKKFISKLLVLAMSVSLIFGVSQPALAAQNATISGTLYDANGNPMANKTVRLRERSTNDNGSRYSVLHTDASGKYTISVPAGDYQVIGFPFSFSSAKLKGTADWTQVCAVAQSVIAEEGASVTQDLYVPVPVEVPNGEFEMGTGESQDLTDWTFAANSNGKYRNNAKDCHSGNGHLSLWASNDFRFEVYQQLTGVAAGTYTIQYSLEAEVADSDEAYFYVKDAAGNILAREDVRTTQTANPVYEVFGMTVRVTGGPITIGVAGNCSGGKWINVDELRMGKLSVPMAYTKAELKTLLDSAAAYTAEGYTPASFETLSTARTNAQTVYNKTAASDSEITTAYQTLQSAINGLVPARPDGAPGIQNDIFWRDTTGNIIYSQGGGIFKFNDTYYWYGVKYVEAETYANNPSVMQKTNTFAGVTCYSSKDLVNWKYEGLVVKPSEVSGHADIKGQTAAWVGRLGVAKVGNQYALFVQHECPDADNSMDNDGANDQVSKQVLVLTASTPNGNFKWNQRINMKGYTGGSSNTGDQTVFTDEDTGKSYLLYSFGRGRGSMFLSEIVAQANGKVGLASAHKIYQGAGREGNCMFKYKNKYYVCASDLYGWNASHAYYLVLNSLTDSYLNSFKAVTNMTLMDGSSADFCHVTQTGFFYTVKGSQQETVIFCGDRWTDFAKNGLGYNQWCPLSFKTDGTPCFNSLSAWDLNVETGKWTVHDSNNYVKNGSFDADRVNSTQLAGWTNKINKGTAPINNNGNTTTGKYALKLGDSVDFDCKVSQVITQDTKTADAVVLPDGTYTLTAQVRNSGTFEELSLYATSGNNTKKARIEQENSKYTEVTLEDITVTGGRAEIGFIAKGKANAYALIDDVSFVRFAEERAVAEARKALQQVTASVSGNSDNGTLQMQVDDTEQITIQYPDGLQDKVQAARRELTTSFDSSKPGVARVDSTNGTITAVAPGEAEITATVAIGNDSQDKKSFVLNVVVKEKPVTTVSVESVTLDKSEITMEIGNFDFLIANVEPENATDKTVTWVSSEPSVASVEKGLVKAQAAGETTITASAGGKTATCKVVVRGKETPGNATTLNPTVSQEGTGSINVNVDAGSIEPGKKTEVAIDIPGSIAENIRNCEGNKVSINVNIPDGMKNNENIDLTTITLPKEALEAAKSLGKELIITINGDSSYRWVFTAQELASATIAEKNLLIEMDSAREAEAKLALNDDAKGIAFTVPQQEQGTVSGSVSVDTAEMNWKQGDEVKLSTYNPATKTLVAVSGTYTVDENRRVTVNNPEAGTTYVLWTKITGSVTGITLDKGSLTLTVGTGEKLQATVLPESAADTPVTWKSSKESVATVAQDGTVTAKAVGETTITAAAGDKTATCTVVVTETVTLKTEITSQGGGKFAMTVQEGFAPDKETAVSIAIPGSLADNIKNSTEKQVSVDVNIPKSLISNGKINWTAITLPKEVLEAAKGAEKDLIITVNGDSSYQWVFTAEELKSVTITEQNLLVEKDGARSAEVKNALNADEEGMVFSFVQAVPGSVSVDTAGMNWKPGDAVNLSYYDFVKRQLEPVSGTYQLDADGKVTIKDPKAGSYILWRKTAGNEEPTVIRVTKLKLNTKKLTLGGGEKFTLKVTITPKDATDKKVAWTSSNKKAATVNKTKGVVTAKKVKKPAKTTITATVDGKKITCAVTVKPAPKKIALNAKTKTLKKGKTFQVKVKKYTPSNAASYKLTYSIDKKGKKVVSVDSKGKIKAKKKGKATITVMAFNKKKATIKITVK